ncbi:MAG TPA: DNA-3-methyladenine glycosylase [Hyphomicrobiaceae bacterium]
MLDEAERFVRRVFLLDEDPAPFLEAAARDPLFHALVRRFSGLRPVLIADPFETLLWAVAGQQVNVSFARKLKLALVEACGRCIRVDGEEYRLTPTAQEVARLDPAALAARQFSRQKAEYTLGLARAAASGALNFAMLARLPAEEAIASLTRWRGVGRWTAEYVLMRGLGARDVLPAGDLGLQQAIGRAYGLGRTATEVEVRRIAEQWAGWRGWAAFYWWLSIQVERFAVRMPL